MKKTILFSGSLLLVMLMISCKKDQDILIQPFLKSSVPEEKTLTDFFIKNGTPSQTFVINSIRDTSIYFPKSSMYIPKNSFVKLNNQAVIGAVTIEVKLLVNKKDMILNGIFSVSDGKPLVSAGEFFIKATQNGEELKLAFQKQLYVSIYIMGPLSNNMQVFYADNLNANTNWGIPSSSDTVNISSASPGPLEYHFPISNLRWINCDYFYDKPGLKTIVKVSVNGEEYNNNNTHVFITLDKLNAACMFTSYSKPYFFTPVNYELPVGQKVTIVAISEIGGQYFSAFQSAIFTDNHIENLTMSPTTIDDFKLQLGSLP